MPTITTIVKIESCLMEKINLKERYSCTRMKIHRQSRQLLVQSQGGYIGLFSTTEPYKMNKSKRFEGHKVIFFSQYLIEL